MLLLPLLEPTTLTSLAAQPNAAADEARVSIMWPGFSYRCEGGGGFGGWRRTRRGEGKHIYEQTCSPSYYLQRPARWLPSNRKLPIAGGQHRLRGGWRMASDHPKMKHEPLTSLHNSEWECFGMGCLPKQIDYTRRKPPPTNILYAVVCVTVSYPRKKKYFHIPMISIEVDASQFPRGGKNCFKV